VTINPLFFEAVFLLERVRAMWWGELTINPLFFEAVFSLGEEGAL
jgi:hypothetical protein